MNQPSIIQGGNFADDRGLISFVNDFDMSPVKRFYHISPKDPSIIRAWQGHQIESKWFHVSAGKFQVRLIQVDNWETPSKDLPYTEFILSAADSQVLHIPGGYANGFRALEENSSLLVFSDIGIDNAADDDFRFPADYWFDWK